MAILVVVYHLKMSIYIPCMKDADSPELAPTLFNHVIYNGSVRDNVLRDCSNEFTCRFYNRVCSHLCTTHRLSTTCLPQTDGQTVGQNQTIQLYVCGLTNCKLDHLVQPLHCA